MAPSLSLPGSLSLEKRVLAKISKLDRAGYICKVSHLAPSPPGNVMIFLSVLLPDLGFTVCTFLSPQAYPKALVAQNGEMAVTSPVPKTTQGEF